MDASTSPEVSLDDKYTADQGRIYLTGVQALVLLSALALVGLVALFF